MNTQLQKENIVELPEGLHYSRRKFKRCGTCTGAFQSLVQLGDRPGRDHGAQPPFGMNGCRLALTRPKIFVWSLRRMEHMVGYIEVWTTAKPPVHPWIWGRVDPDYEGLGIGTWLLALG